MYEQERISMVNDQIKTRGVSTISILTAMKLVPRHEFVSKEIQQYAYDDEPLSLGYSRVLESPFLTARLLELAEPVPESSLLVVGSGTGYLAAIASYLFGNVVASESIEELAQKSRKILGALCLTHVHIVQKPTGSFDSIIVEKDVSEIPQPLLDLLTPSGRLVVPLRKEDAYELVVVRRKGASTTYEQTSHSCVAPKQENNFIK